MLLDYLKFHSSIFFITVFIICLLITLTILLFKSKKEILAIGCGVCVLAVLLLTTLSANFWFDRPSSTIVVMPDKQNLRLAEDGQLSFCVNGFARTWKGTKEGVVSTEAKIFNNRPMRCYSVDESVEYLRKAGASDSELERFRAVYK
jgi:hypothetical protein